MVVRVVSVVFGAWSVSGRSANGAMSGQNAPLGLYSGLGSKTAPEH